MGSQASNTSTRLSDFLASAERVAKDLVVPLLFALAGLVASWRRRATVAIMVGATNWRTAAARRNRRTHFPPATRASRL